MTTTDAAEQLPTATVLPPADASELFDWHHPTTGLATREFVGTVRTAVGGFRVTIEGEQRANGTCRRWLTIEVEQRGELLEPEIARQYAAAITAAADEIEHLR